MKNLLLLVPVFFSVLAFGNEQAVDSLHYGSFGKVFIYKPVTEPEALVLFVSGDGGWNQLPENLSRKLLHEGAMVAGINISRYLTRKMTEHEKCYYPAGDFEELSLFLQKKYKFRNYLKPILMGYSSGATLVYGILAQAPANTFKGAIAMGFCPDIATVVPLCTTAALKQHPTKPGGPIWILEPSDKLTAPFIVINGIDDKVCDYPKTVEFMKKVNTGELIGIPKAGHGMSVEKNYFSNLVYAYKKIKNSVSYTGMIAAKTSPAAKTPVQKPESSLPLVVLPETKPSEEPLLFFISGDGGWTSFDQSVAEKLVARGAPVVGLDAQKYFWQARTPDETATEINKVLRFYLGAWNKKSFILCGYSFGADIIPYLATRLQPDVSPMLKAMIMMSPDTKADFEIHVSDMLSFGNSHDTFDVVSELRKSKARVHSVCIFGSEEDSQPARLFEAAGATIRILPGQHHYGNNYNAIVNEILR